MEATFLLMSSHYRQQRITTEKKTAAVINQKSTEFLPRRPADASASSPEYRSLAASGTGRHLYLPNNLRLPTTATEEEEEKEREFVNVISE